MAKAAYKTKDGHAFTADLAEAEAITHLEGDNYVVQIGGVNHYLEIPNTSAEELHGIKEARAKK